MTSNKSWKILVGDCRERLKDLPDESVHMIWTSPPYFGLRSYTDDEAEMGKESTPDEFVQALTEVMREARRVLRDDGTLWLNLGDCYAQKKGHGHWTSSSDKGDENGQRVTKGWADRGAKDIGLKPQDLIGIPWRAAFSLQEDGWYLRSDIIWAKGISGQDDFAQKVYEVAINNGVDPKVATQMMKDLDLYAGNPMPESVKSRPSSAHEHLFLFSKSSKYFYDHIAAKEASVSDHPSGNGFKRQARLSYKDEDGARGNDDQWEMTQKRNLRNVWCVPTKPFREAHFATAPEALVKKCIEIGTSEVGCCDQCGTPYARVSNSKGWEPTCICHVSTQDLQEGDLEIISSPTGTNSGSDPTMKTGRRGMNRPRGDEEGVREMTRYEQRKYAEQIKESPYRNKMEEDFETTTFAHYIRTDRSGARPVPHDTLEVWISKGWLNRVEPPELLESEPIPCTVLDPFAGAATTLLVAEKLGRNSIGIELNPEYVEIAENRLAEYTRDSFDQWDDRYIPLESDDEIPDEVELSDLFGK